MYWVIDLLFILLFSTIILMCYRRGFVRGLLETVGMIVALIVAMNIGNELGTRTYDRVVEPKMVSISAKTVNDATHSAVDEFFKVLPDNLQKNALFNGLKRGAIEGVDRYLDSETEKVVTNTSQKYIRPTLVYVIGASYTLLIFIFLSFAVRFAAKYINKFISFGRITGKLNRLLGAALGIPRGFIACVILALILLLLNRLYGSSFFLTTDAALRQSMFYRFLISVTPFA